MRKFFYPSYWKRLTSLIISSVNLEEQALSSIVNRSLNWSSYCIGQCSNQYLSKSKMHIPFDSTISCVRIYPTDVFVHCLVNRYGRMFIQHCHKHWKKLGIPQKVNVYIDSDVYTCRSIRQLFKRMSNIYMMIQSSETSLS